MWRQYFADTLGEPIGVDHATITATTETVLIPTIFTPIPAFEPRVGKVYELIVIRHSHYRYGGNTDHYAAFWHCHRWG